MITLNADNILYFTSTGIARLENNYLPIITKAVFSEKSEAQGADPAIPEYAGPEQGGIVYTSTNVQTIPVNDNLLLVRVTIGTEGFTFGQVTLFNDAAAIAYFTYPVQLTKTANRPPYQVEFIAQRPGVSYKIFNTGKEVASVPNESSLPVNPTLKTSFLTFILTQVFRSSDNYFKVAYLKDGAWAFEYMPLAYPPRFPPSLAGNSYFSDTRTPSQDRDYQYNVKAKSLFNEKARNTFGQIGDEKSQGFVYLKEGVYEPVNLPEATTSVFGIVRLAEIDNKGARPTDVVTVKTFQEFVSDAVAPVKSIQEGGEPQAAVYSDNLRQAAEAGFKYPVKYNIDDDNNTTMTVTNTGDGRALLIEGQARFSGVLEIANGDDSNPSIAFTNDMDTGFFLTGSNALGITVGGTHVVTISKNETVIENSLVVDVLEAAGPILRINRGEVGNGATNLSGIEVDRGTLTVTSWVWEETEKWWTVNGDSPSIGDVTLKSVDVLLNKGSATTPSLRFAGDLDTGFYSAGDDIVGFSLGGEMVAVFDTDGVNYVTSTGEFETKGSQTITSAADGNDAAVVIRSFTEQYAIIDIQNKDGKSRWHAGRDAIAESGSNAGSNFIIERFNDAGVSQGVAVSINRATGKVDIPDLILPAPSIDYVEQATEPVDPWIGLLWKNTHTSIINGVPAGYTGIWNGTEWANINSKYTYVIQETAPVSPFTGFVWKNSSADIVDGVVAGAVAIWNGSAWDTISSASVDLSNYYTKTEVDAAFASQVPSFAIPYYLAG